MGIESKLLEDMKVAMKSGDKLTLETIRMLRAQLKNASLGKDEPLPEEEVLSIIQKEAKRHKESITLYKQGGRDDLVKKESQELKVIQSYLPASLTEAEISTIVDQVITQVNATGMQDMGKVMGLVMPQVKGRADGKLVQEQVKKKLS